MAGFAHGGGQLQQALQPAAGGTTRWTPARAQRFAAPASIASSSTRVTSTYRAARGLAGRRPHPGRPGGGGGGRAAAVSPRRYPGTAGRMRLRRRARRRWPARRRPTALHHHRQRRRRHLDRPPPSPSTPRRWSPASTRWTTSTSSRSSWSRARSTRSACSPRSAARTPCRCRNSYIDLYDADGDLILNADGGKPGDPAGPRRAADLQGPVHRDLLHQRPRLRPGRRPARAATASATTSSSAALRPPTPTARLHALYSPDSPLHSIDWGTQIDAHLAQSRRRQRPARQRRAVHRHAAGNPPASSGKNVITFYFAKTGDVFVDESPGAGSPDRHHGGRATSPTGRRPRFQAFDLYEQVADLVYIEVQNRDEADFNIITYKGTPGGRVPAGRG